MIFENDILTQYYEEVLLGNKNFELRRDFDQKAGDFLLLKEFDGEKLTGRKSIYRITYVLRNVEIYGLMKGNVILSIEK